MIENEQQALRFCDVALEHMWRGEFDLAIDVYDQAMAAAGSEETRELITIRKAEALIAADREGEEVRALPQIIMRRRTPRHVYIAAAVLMRRLCEQDDRRRAIFYGEIARQAAAEGADPLTRASILNALGVTLVADSQFKAAIDVLDEGLAALAVATDRNEHIVVLGAAMLANLGGAKVLSGEIEDGLRMLESALPRLIEEVDRVEAYLDLCFGYLETGKHEVAERFGREALAHASVRRQVRNANHLLGEICLRTGRYEESDRFFDVVAAYYPEFKNVKQLLVAVDLCSVINWKG